MRWGRFHLEFGSRTLIMGILNVTPDSFSDGGRFLNPGQAVARAREMVSEGADVIDVGGESTRPGAHPVSTDEEIRRVIPIVEALAPELPVPISVDTQKAAVARAALLAGAGMINDIWGLQGDPGMADTVAGFGVPVVVMHNKLRPEYPADLMGEISEFLRVSGGRARAAGIPREMVIVDPGFGFGKKVGHNLELVARLGELADLGYPILLGPSRKSTIGRVLDLPVDDRVEGTAALVALAISRGADVVRVHDVRQMARVARMTDAVVRPAVRAAAALRDAEVTAYLGLGANLGDRAGNIRRALELLDRVHGISIRRVSPLYETEPVGVRDQPLFLNAVAEVAVAIAPELLLEHALAVERELGRERRRRLEPRTIDIDILVFGDRRIDSPDLIVPHPCLRERAFALVPLAHLAPDLVLPGGGRVADLARAVLDAAPGAVLRYEG